MKFLVRPGLVADDGHTGPDPGLGDVEAHKVAGKFQRAVIGLPYRCAVPRQRLRIIIEVIADGATRPQFCEDETYFFWVRARGIADIACRLFAASSLVRHYFPL